MRDRVAVVVFLLAVVAAAVGGSLLTTDAPPSAAPNADFAVTGDPSDTVTVEHVGGDSLDSGAVRVLVYEDRPLIPDRTVHATTWEEPGLIQETDRLEVEDPRFESGQRLVVRWFGDEGPATLYETHL